MEGAAPQVFLPLAFYENRETVGKMSVAAMAWAFRQKLPPKPKMLLLALADQTDETTGRVCYGKTDLAHLAEKCSIPERSLTRFIGALVRNDYIVRSSGKEKRQANSYWLCLDRAVAESIKEWQWTVDAESPEPQDVVEDSAILADEESAAEVSDDVQNGRRDSANGGRHRVSEEPRDIRDRPIERTGSSFSRKTQDTEIEQERLERAAAKEGSRAFVIEGSRAWVSWCDYRKARGQVPSFPTTTALIEGRTRRGWWLPTLFPPDAPATGPPTQASEEDHAVMAGLKR